MKMTPDDIEQGKEVCGKVIGLFIELHDSEVYSWELLQSCFSKSAAEILARGLLYSNLEVSEQLVLLRKECLGFSQCATGIFLNGKMEEEE
jgi:hypothetical protein